MQGTGVTGRAAAAVLAATLLFASLACVLLARIAWQSPPASCPAPAALARILPWAPDYPRALARLDLAAGHPAAARAHLAAALQRSPFDAELWLARAEAGLQIGRPAEARRAALQGAALAPVDASACWRAALVLLQVGDGPAAVALLRCVLENAPGRAAEVLDLAHMVYGDDNVVLEVVPPDADHVRQFLGWAYDRTLGEAAALGWDALQPLGPTAADRLHHVDFLLAGGHVDGAETLWTDAYGSRQPTGVFDGGFERDPVGTGFGWHLGRLDGARIAIEGGAAAAHGARGLAIDFAGGNLDFAHVSQVVPVAGGRRYRLSALVRTEAITSLSAPRLTVLPHASCLGMEPASGSELSGTRPWTPQAIEFVTPLACRAIVVLVRRVPTTRLDRDLRGRLYLDDVALADLGDASATDSASAATSRSRNTSPGM